MKNKIKNIFISHVHEDDSKLKELKDLLEKAGMVVRDYSINSDKPNRAKNEDYIKNEILAPQIDQCSVLVVYISSETKNSKYVDWEIEYAHKQDKGIVGVWGRGEKECALPDSLDSYADEVVGWNSSSIIDAIIDAIDRKGSTPIFKDPDGKEWPERKIKRRPC